MEAMNQAKAEVFTIDAEQAVDTNEQPEQKASDAEKIKHFINELVSCGYDATMARKSVNHVDQADIDSGDVSQGKDNWDIHTLFDGLYEISFGPTKCGKICHVIMHVV